MVTTIYTPPLTHMPGFRQQQQRRNPQVDSDDLQQSKRPNFELANTGDATEDQGERRGRQQAESSLAERIDQAQRIGIAAILKDFQKTMDAIKASQNIQQEVLPYLQVVAHQSQQPFPSVGLMKQNLLSAAKALDTHIAASLGKESNVVIDWMKAVLMQPVDYHNEGPITLKGTANPNRTMSFDDLVDPPSAPVAYLNGQALKVLLDTAQKTLKAGNKEAARALYSQILAGTSAQDHAGLRGRILMTLARLANDDGQPEVALPLLTQAVQSLTPLASPSEPGAKALFAQAQLAEQLENPELATAAYRDAAMVYRLLENTSGEKNATQSLVQLLVQQRQLDEAEAVLSAALAFDNTEAESMQWLEQLGNVYRQQQKLKPAFNSYQQALVLAHQLHQPQALTKIATGLAGLYLDTNKPHKALQVLQKTLPAV